MWEPSWVAPEQCEASLKMLPRGRRVAEDKWRERPFVSQSNCFVVPPLKFATDACRCLEVAVRGGMPVLLLSAGQAGATAPASLAGAIVQEVAEVLAGLVYVNAIRPGAVAIFGTWPFVSDLRTGAMSGGSPEQALLSAACGQIGAFLRPDRRHRLGHDGLQNPRTPRPEWRRPTTMRWWAIPAPT